MVLQYIGQMLLKTTSLDNCRLNCSLDSQNPYGSAITLAEVRSVLPCTGEEEMESVVLRSDATTPTPDSAVDVGPAGRRRINIAVSAVDDSPSFATTPTSGGWEWYLDY